MKVDAKVVKKFGMSMFSSLKKGKQNDFLQTMLHKREKIMLFFENCAFFLCTVKKNS